jgi:hypothetical protein
MGLDHQKVCQFQIQGSLNSSNAIFSRIGVRGYGYAKDSNEKEIEALSTYHFFSICLGILFQNIWYHQERI